MNSEIYIKSKIKEFRPKSQQINYLSYHANDSAKRFFKFTFSDGNGYRIYAFRKQIEIEIKFENSIHFAINRPDIAFVLNKELKIKNSLNKIFISTDTKQKPVRKCIDLCKIQLEKLNLQKQEAVYIYHNGIMLLLNNTREIVPELKILSAIKSIIELNFPEIKYTVDTGKAPDELKELIPLLEEWAISDDGERDEKIAGAGKKELQNLINIVSSKMELINSYLDSFKRGQVPEVATLFGSLAELVSELQLKNKKK